MNSRRLTTSDHIACPKSERERAIVKAIFAEAARDWMAGKIDDKAAVAMMAGNFRRLCGIWDAARAAAEAKR